MHQSLQGATFHIEHVLPRTKNGTDDPINLALACPSCNLHKSDRVTVVQKPGDQQVPLYHPRHDHWHDHFQWQGAELTGITAVGKATIEALQLNSPRRKQIREMEYAFGLFPPD